MGEYALLKLDPLFTEGMMLQREKPVKVWGEAHPFDELTATIQGQSVETKVDENGKWMVEFAPLHTSHQEMLTVSTDSQLVILEDIAVGEVWIAGGQSNMEFEIFFEKQRTAGRKFADNADIRFFDIPEVCYPGQLEAFDYSRVNRWRKVTDQDIDWFSAVGYYFAEKLNQDMEIPVGIIGCNWGGTRAAHWMKPEHVEEYGKIWFDDFKKKLDATNMEGFWEKQNSDPMNDHGNHLDEPFTRFMLPRTPSGEEIAAFFAQLMGQMAGASNEAANAINFSGETADTGSDGADEPAKDVETAENPANESGAAENLAGEGQTEAPAWNAGLTPQQFPGCLYENMVKRLAPFTARGVIWYQGESDDELTGGPEIYDRMMKTVIADWRELWNDRLPFLQVELAGFETWLAVTAQDYPTLRAKQKQVTLEDPDVYLCSITDVGEQFDIHPKDKATVGRRLALLAEGHIYGRKESGKMILCDAPEAVSAEKSADGKQIIITFKNTGDGLSVRGEKISDLIVTTGERECTYTCEVKGNQVIILLNDRNETARTLQPVNVSLAWSNWHCVNLYNSAGIPAFPFRFTV